VAVYAGLYGPTGIEYPNGQHAANVAYRVLNGSSVEIPLYMSKSRAVSKPNPGQTDEYGNISFYANPGEYILDLVGIQMPISVGLHPDEPISGGGGPGGPLDYEEIINIPTTDTQITHNLGFDPAGVVCLKTGGTRVYPRISYPDPGYKIRLQFPGNFTGTVLLS
jgi:hypothetical protein